MIDNILDYLKPTAKRLPDKVAFADEKTELTFLELDQITDSIATCLHQKGYYKEPILIYMKKSPEEIASFYGVIRSGCFYVPIDDEMPLARIRLIIENCHPRACIVGRDMLSNEKELGFDGEVIVYEDIMNTPHDEDALDLIHERAIDTDPIYIVFTSGSTGVPKGVCACHRSVIDYVNQLSDSLHFDQDTVFGNQTPLYFDACLKEVYPTIMFGATTYLIPHEYFSFPVKLVTYLNEKKINTICWVVSALTMISAFNTFNDIVPQYLRTVAFGSEVFPIKQYRKWRKALPNTEFYNLYGPTEGTGMSCIYHCPETFEDDEVIPIGKPFHNTEVILLKEDNTRAAQGEEGEICLRGTCVTLGYYNNPEKTSESYTQNPLNTAYPELIYRTGDLAIEREDGNLVFVSRKDYQIKHMGHRIELGEIEADVSAIDGVKICACVYDRVKSKIKLFYVGDMEPGELIEEMKKSLPRYMLPNRTKKLEEMPFTANGKIDRKTLQTM
ncbi:MAG: amino acid adenylation domain-containing protein [Lachnospiraceae bacterium]|nr:amino acid adenylation domain-containing protein [Lachnospiraceae bacterium]